MKRLRSLALLLAITLAVPTVPLLPKVPVAKAAVGGHAAIRYLTKKEGSCQVPELGPDGEIVGSKGESYESLESLYYTKGVYEKGMNFKLSSKEWASMKSKVLSLGEKDPTYDGTGGKRYITWHQVDKKRSGTSYFQTAGYRVTPKPIWVGDGRSDHIRSCSNFKFNYQAVGSHTTANTTGLNYILTIFVAPLDDVIKQYNYMTDLNDQDQDLWKSAKNDKNQELTLYLQPEIAVYEAEQYKGTMLCLQDWLGALGWSDPSTFSSHYNRKMIVTLDIPPAQAYTNYIKRGTYNSKYMLGDSVLKKQKEKKTPGVPATVNFQVENGIPSRSKGAVSRDAIFKKCITDDEGKNWWVTKVYVIRKSGKEKGEPKQKLTAEVDSRVLCNSTERSNPGTTTVTSDSRNRTNNGPTLENLKLSYNEYVQKIKDTVLQSYMVEDMYIFFEYQKEGTLPKPELTIQYERQMERADGKHYWVPLTTAETVKNVAGKVFHRDFDRIPVDFPCYGLYSTHAALNKTEEKIKNDKTGKLFDVTKVGGNPVYFDTTEWKEAVQAVGSVAYKIPKEEPVTVVARYAARMPVIKLLYQYDPNKKVYKKIAEETLGRACPGHVEKVKFDKTVDGLTFQQHQISNGDVAGFAGAKTNAWTDTRFPASASTDKKTTATLTVNEFKPTIVVGVYGTTPPPDTTPPPVTPSTPTPTPEPTPPPVDPDKPAEDNEHQWHTDNTTIYRYDSREGVTEEGSSVKDAADVVGSVYTANDSYSAKITSDNEKSDPFDVKQGIPSSEYVMTRGVVKQYETDTEYVKHDLDLHYKINVQYDLMQIEAVGSHVETYVDSKGKVHTTIVTDYDWVPHRRSRMYTIDRGASYYTCNYFYLYTPQDLAIKNGSFPSDKPLQMKAHKNPAAKCKVIVSPTGNWRWNTVLDYTPYAGEFYDVAPSSGQLRGLAEAQVGHTAKVTNDDVKQGVPPGSYRHLMKKQWMNNSTEEPKIPQIAEDTPYYVFQKKAVQIPGTRANKEYSSKAAVHYRVTSRYANRADRNLDFFTALDCNHVSVHTPVINDFTVIKDDSHCQLITPSKDKNIVLDTKFTVDLPTVGTHRAIPMYGRRNYQKWIDHSEVRFPIDVYSGDGTIFYARNIWITVASGTTEFLTASWNDEGNFIMQSRTFAINSAANDGMLKQGDSANFDTKQYVARHNDYIDVSGRMYGLNIFDVSDYPLWQDTFRVGDTWKKTGFRYTSGLANRNGYMRTVSSKETFPMVKGDHPKFVNEGIPSIGYNIRFSLTTVGEMDDGDDAIHIVPKFYYVSKDGKTRYPVDVYYDETVNGRYQRLIKVGSYTDLGNRKSLNVGNKTYSIGNQILSETAGVLGYKSMSDFIKSSKFVYTFGDIKIPSTMRTFNGTWHKTILDSKNYEGVSLVKPEGIPYNKKSASVQRWWCSYYLPAKTHAVRKGFDVMTAAKSGIDYREDFWCKDGYLMINFDVTAINGGKRKLAYGSESSYSNMWKTEMAPSSKMDYKGNVFHLKEGDFVMFNLDHSAADDYVSGGTH